MPPARDVPIRVLLSKIGLDTHDRGIKLVAAWIRDAGMEVIYLGPYKTVEDVTAAAVQEDVDVIGTSFLDGGHLGWLFDLRAALDEADAADIPIVVGGIIPAEDEVELLRTGVAAVLHPGTPMEDIVETFRLTAAKEARTKSA